jgi:hypothetical protein
MIKTKNAAVPPSKYLFVNVCLFSLVIYVLLLYYPQNAFRQMRRN